MSIWPISQSAYAATHSGPTILVFGDSLSAAYGIPREKGWVSLLQSSLADHKPTYRIINASISGETTSGGIHRLKRVLDEHKPDYVLLQLGANDGLRGLPVADIRRNLGNMITLSQQAGAQVMLVGIMIPPNYGPRYTQEFKDSYALLAKQYHLPFVPFLLEGVAGDPTLMQEDGLHPTAAAQPILLENVWKVMRPELRAKEGRSDKRAAIQPGT